MINFVDKNFSIKERFNRLIFYAGIVAVMLATFLLIVGYHDKSQHLRKNMELQGDLVELEERREVAEIESELRLEDYLFSGVDLRKISKEGFRVDILADSTGISDINEYLEFLNAGGESYRIARIEEKQDNASYAFEIEGDIHD